MVEIPIMDDLMFVCTIALEMDHNSFYWPAYFPGESASAIQDTYLTGKDEAIVLSAVEDFVDEDAEGGYDCRGGHRYRWVNAK